MLFILPMTGKLSWRNLPAITIIIILINCFVFFFFQSNDKENTYKALEYYYNSGLAQIEAKNYLMYLRNQGNEVTDIDIEESFDEETLNEMLYRMNQDALFMKKLRQEKIITPSHSSYKKWKALRNQYENRLSKVVSNKYGFSPAKKKPVTLLTSMFLHGGFGHLFGNMILLWIVGCVIELSCGRAIYSTLYLSSGLVAVAAFWLMNMDSTGPLIGASGAISGVVGALPVFFGKRKIKIFYTVAGIFFNYTKVPSYLFFLAWLGNELYGILFLKHTNIAFFCHIGGLISGALFAFIIVKFYGVKDESIIDEVAAQEEEKDSISPLIEQALEKIENVDMDGARRLLDQVLSQDPGNVIAMTHLFNMDKINPDSPQFHATTKKLLQGMMKNKAMENTFYDFYDQYSRLAKKPQLSAEIYVNVAGIAASKGQTETAEKILAMLLKHKPNTQGLSASLLKLAIAFGRKNLDAKRITCLKIINTKFPDSIEAQAARRALANSMT